MSEPLIGEENIAVRVHSDRHIPDAQEVILGGPAGLRLGNGTRRQRRFMIGVLIVRIYIIESRRDRREGLRIGQGDRTAVHLGPSEYVAAVRVEVDRRRISIRCNQFARNEGLGLARSVKRFIERVVVAPNDDRRAVRPHFYIRFAIFRRTDQLRADHHIVGQGQTGFIVPAGTNSGVITVPLRIGGPRNDKIAVGIARNTRCLLRTVRLNIDKELIGQRTDRLHRSHRIDIDQIRIGIGERNTVHAAVGIEIEGKMVPFGQIDIPLNRKAAGVNVEVIVFVFLIVDRRLPRNGEIAGVVKRDGRIELILFARSFQNRITVIIVNDIAVFIERVLGRLRRVDPEDGTRLFDRLDQIGPGIRRVRRGEGAPLAHLLYSGRFETADLELLMIDVAAVAGKRDLEFEIGDLPPIDLFGRRFERLNRNLDLRHLLGGVIKIFLVGAKRLARCGGIFIRLNGGIIEPRTLKRRVKIGAGGPLEGGFQFLGDFVRVSRNRNAGRFPGRGTFSGNQGRFGNRLDQRTGDKTALIDLVVNRHFRRFLCEERAAIGVEETDVKVPFGVGVHLNAGVFFAERTERGLEIRRVFERGQILVKRKLDRFAVDVERQGSVDAGLFQRRIIVRVIDRRGGVEGKPLDHRRAVNQLERRSGPDLVRVDRNRDDLHLIGHVACVNIQVFADFFAGHRVNQLVRRGPDSHRVVRAVDRHRYLPANILPFGIDQNILGRADAQTQKRPLLKRIDQQMAGFQSAGLLGSRFSRKKTVSDRFVQLPKPAFAHD